MSFKSFLYEELTKTEMIEEWELINARLEVLVVLVKKLSERSDEIEDMLLPIVKAVTGQQTAIKNAVLTYKSSPGRTTYAYKTAFEMALTKVDDATRKELEAFAGSVDVKKVGDPTEHLKIVSPKVARVAMKLKNAKTVDDLRNLAKAVLKDTIDDLEEGVKELAAGLIKRLKRWVGNLMDRIGVTDDAIEELNRAAYQRMDEGMRDVVSYPLYKFNGELIKNPKSGWYVVRNDRTHKNADHVVAGPFKRDDQALSNRSSLADPTVGKIIHWGELFDYEKWKNSGRHRTQPSLLMKEFE